jgi:drug/metabolite transporter (DMT)-like permease
VLYRPYLQRYPTVPVSAFAMLASVLFLALIALREDWPAQISGLDARPGPVIAFIGCRAASATSGGSMPEARVAHAGDGLPRAQPVTAALLGWLLLGEPLQASLLAGLALIALGLWLATRAPSAKRQAAAG